MTDSPRAASARPATPPPGPVTAAALVTVLASGGTAAMALLMAMVFGQVIATLASDFDGLGAWGLGVAAGLLGLCSVAVVAAVGLLRRRRWAWWTLLVVSSITAVLGVAGRDYVLPLGATAAAVAVVVLLLLPSTRTWLAQPRACATA